MKHYQWVKAEKEKLFTAKVICSTRSSWSAPVIGEPKGDGGKHLVIDYRALNKVRRKFTWPMPKVEDIFSKLNRATYFTTLYLRAGSHHIPLDKPLIPKMAFNSPFRKYEYIKVPFGLAQVPSSFQELMTGIPKDFSFVIAYLDDIIIFSKTPQGHLSQPHICHRRSLMPFLGDTLSWLTGTATTKDINSIKTWINQLIATKEGIQKTKVSKTIHEDEQMQFLF